MVLSAVVNNESGTSQGFGFIGFLDSDERDRSIAELDGLTAVGTKPVTMQIAETPQPQNRWALRDIVQVGGVDTLLKECYLTVHCLECDGYAEPHSSSVLLSVFES